MCGVAGVSSFPQRCDVHVLDIRMLMSSEGKDTAFAEGIPDVRQKQSWQKLLLLDEGGEDS